MGESPGNYFPGLHSGALGTGHDCCVMSDSISVCGTTYATAGVWPAANRALYIPFEVRVITSIKQIAWFNGGTVNGNVDVAIYDETLARLGSAGSTAQAGVSAVQAVDITDIDVMPGGTYFLGFASDSATATFIRASISAILEQACGVQQQAAAFPLPNPMVPAGGVPATNYIPLVSLIYESATF